MATKKVELTLEERIDRARDGRTQTWVVNKLNEILPADEKITEVKFSRKKKGHEEFTETEMNALQEILEEL